RRSHHRLQGKPALGLLQRPLVHPRAEAGRWHSAGERDAGAAPHHSAARRERAGSCDRARQPPRRPPHRPPGPDDRPSPGRQRPYIVKGRRGFTLLEMIVATTILGVAVTGLLSGLAGVTRNATRLREYDRAVQLARLRMNDLLADTKAPHRVPLE